MSGDARLCSGTVTCTVHGATVPTAVLPTHNRGALTVADAHAPEARARFNKMTDEQRMRTTLNQNYLVNDIVPEIPGPWMAKGTPANAG